MTTVRTHLDVAGIIRDANAKIESKTMNASVLPSTYSGPGLVDIQVNGYAGFDFNSDPSQWRPEGLHAVRQRLLQRGVTAILPTIITDAAQNLLARAKAYADLVSADQELARTFPGLHIEGPFISPIDGPRGAHPKAHCLIPQAMPDLIQKINDASGGRVIYVTVAPELPGAADMITRLVSRKIRVSLGHHQANPAAIAAAVEAGATFCTHLGNGSHSMLPRLDNYIQYQLAEERLWGSFIPDGHHMPFTTLRNFLRAKGLDHAVVTTDCIAAAEMGPGKYVLGGKEVVVTPNGRVQEPGADNLAGSSLTPDMAVINVATHCGVSFDDAWKLISTNPVKLLDLPAQPQVTVKVSPKGLELQ